MAAFRQIITLPLSICSFVSVFYAIGKLMLFLSAPSKVNKEYVWLLHLMDNWSRLEGSLLPVTIDAVLIVIFILQHSLMRTEIVKSIWDKIGLATAARSIYNLTTASVLLFLLKEWKTIPTFILWNIDVESSNILYWTFVVTHGISWIIIYGGSIIMDLPEITGVKQVYYDMNNLLSPITYKSRELIRLYEHVRHPSFFGFTIILWFTNLMSLDRLLLATLWTIYMFIAWQTDANDVAYQKAQLRRKKLELLK